MSDFDTFSSDTGLAAMEGLKLGAGYLLILSEIYELSACKCVANCQIVSVDIGFVESCP